MSRKPIKRHPAIAPISREHHHGLLVGWKLRMGKHNNVSALRIRKYLNWFYTHHLIPHFVDEEFHLFPILGKNHVEVKRALDEHAAIHKFFSKEKSSMKDIEDFEKLITDHIRFEERVLFQSIQEVADESALEHLAQHLQDHEYVENIKDEFWLTGK